MKFLSVFALLGATIARHHLNQRDFIQLGFAGGMDQNEMDMEVEPTLVKEVPERLLAYPPQSYMQASSDPIKGSLGWPSIPMEDLTPEQQFEVKQRNARPLKLVDDADVTATLKSVQQAESIVGGKFPDPQSPAELAKLKLSPEYHLADDDDEDEDTVETRRSVREAENKLKERWWINAKEKRMFEEKVGNGTIRPQVLDFNNTDDYENHDTQAEIDEKEGKAKVKAIEASKPKEEQAPEKEKTLEEQDQEAKAAAAKSLDDQDKAAAQAEAEFKQKQEDNKKAGGAKADASAGAAAPSGDGFMPAELMGPGGAPSLFQLNNRQMKELDEYEDPARYA